MKLLFFYFKKKIDRDYSSTERVGEVPGKRGSKSGVIRKGV